MSDSRMAEREGFEPSVPRKRDNGFRDRPVRPLRHLSKSMISIDQTAAACEHPANLSPALPQSSSDATRLRRKCVNAALQSATDQLSKMTIKAALRYYNKLNKSSRRSGHALAVAREPAFSFGPTIGGPSEGAAGSEPRSVFGQSGLRMADEPSPASFN